VLIAPELRVTTAEAIAGMKIHFLRPFGRGWVGRRLGCAAWSTFHAGLLHGLGLEAAADLARLAAQERNGATMLVARWPEARIRHAVKAASVRAANAA
jgi:hypothetical protein